MKKQLIRATATAVLAAGLTAGFAGLAAADINTTGPSSQNTEKAKSSYEVNVENDNALAASNTNHQTSNTGDANVKDNTTGGDATSGDASNANDFHAMASVDNSSAYGNVDPSSNAPMSLGDITNTGPDSNNTISSDQKTEVTVSNDNELSVTNSNTQSANSGDASVSHNTTGGNATSGSASNTNSSVVDLEVTN